MHLSLVQTFCGNDPEENRDRTESLIREAVGEGGQVILLQELFHTRYFCQTLDPEAFSLAQSIPGPLTDRLSEIASSLGVVIVAPIFERAAPGVYFNSLIVLERDGRLLGRYRKMHIPEDPGFHEKYYFTPGDLGYKVFNTSFGRIGTLICWDQWFPEAARITALQGADLLVYPTAIGTIEGELEAERKRYQNAWQLIHRSHAIANGCYVASINRTGQEGGTRFWGASFVSDTFGEVIAEAGDDEEILHVSIDLSEMDRIRTTWPFFRDRRIDSYRTILNRWNAPEDPA